MSDVVDEGRKEREKREIEMEEMEEMEEMREMEEMEEMREKEEKALEMAKRAWGPEYRALFFISPVFPLPYHSFTSFLFFLSCCYTAPERKQMGMKGDGRHEIRCSTS
jgi:uncharacterized membrane protein (DUF106 family)